MSVFRVGQRVRIIADPYDGRCIGKEAIITEPAEWRRCYQSKGKIFSYRICIDGVGSHGYHGHYIAAPEWLVPLTDPKAEQFIANLEKLGREPVVTKESPIWKSSDVSRL